MEMISCSAHTLPSHSILGLVADDPYREPGAARRDDVVRTPFRRRRWPMFLVWLGMLSPLAVGMLPLALVGYGVFGAGMIGTGVYRRRAKKILRSPPFRFVWLDPLRALVEVTVRLARAPDDEQVQRIVDALLAISDLSISITDDRIALTGWTWNYDDQLLLAYVLDTWGRPVHADLGIAEITATTADPRRELPFLRRRKMR